MAMLQGMKGNEAYNNLLAKFCPKLHPRLLGWVIWYFISEICHVHSKKYGKDQNLCYLSLAFFMLSRLSSWERANLLALVLMFNFVFVTFPCVVLGQCIDS